MKKFIGRFFSVKNMLKASQRTEKEIPPSREIYKNQLAMAWPSALESVFISLIGAIDTMMVSGLGNEAIAAVGITNQPKFILLAAIFSLNVGVTAVVARRRGEDDPEGANRCMRQAILISLFISIAMSVLGFVFARPILLVAGANEEIIDLAVTYFKTLMFSITVTSVATTVTAAQRGAGNTKISMQTNICANIVNIIFNFLLINGIWIFPKLGVVGAAIATGLGNLTGLVIALLSLVHRSAFVEIGGGVYSWRFDKKTLKGLFGLGSSALVEQLFMRMGFFIYALLVAGLGTVAFATHQICMTVINLSFSFGDGLAVAGSSLVGQSLGAKRPDMAIIYGKVSQRVAFCASTLLFVLFAFGGSFIVGLFSSDPEVISLGSKIMLVIACTTHVQTSSLVYSGCLRGAGDTRYVAVTSMISVGLIRTVGSWLLCYPLGFGLIGAWMGLFCDQTTRFLLNMPRFKRGKWTKIKV